MFYLMLKQFHCSFMKALRVEKSEGKKKMLCFISLGTTEKDAGVRKRTRVASFTLFLFELAELAILL